VQTTLLGLAIALIVALVAALVGPFFIDWNQFRPQFEAEATKVIGAPVRVSGNLDARLLPSPSLRLRSVVVGGANDLGKVRADKLDVEFSLGDLMRGQWRATELTINGLSLDLGLDSQGQLDWTASNGTFNLGSLAIDRLNLTGRAALHDAASRGTLELSDIAFSGDVRSLAGSMRGDGNFKLDGIRYPFRVSSGQNADGNGTRVHLTIDPGERPMSADLDGVLTFEARAPHFDGALTLASPAQPKAKADNTPAPWRISARVKADHSAARLEQLETSYGAEDRALKFAGSGDVSFGAAPTLQATLSARQLDADKLLATDGAAKDNGGGSPEPVHVLPILHGLLAGLPRPPLPAKIELSTEQITLGGRPLQNVALSLRGDADAWMIGGLDLRAPGATHVTFNSIAANSAAAAAKSAKLAGALDIDSSDPDMLVAWLQGRGDTPLRNQRPLRLRGIVSVDADRIMLDALRAEIEGGAVEGRIALASPPNGASRVEAALKAERLDLDAAAAFVRSLAGPPGDWPAEAQISLDVGRAISSGQELRPLTAKFSYSPKTLSLDQLKFGQANGLVTEGEGSFDRANATGKLALSASGASLTQVTALVAPFAPALAARFDSASVAPGPARLKLALDLGKDAGNADRANTRATLDLDAPQLKGKVTLTATPSATAIRSFDLDALGRSEAAFNAKVLAERGDTLLALLGLDRAVAAGSGSLQFEGSATAKWHTPLLLKAKLWGAGLDADADGSAEPWRKDPSASLNVRARSVNLAPMFGLRPSDPDAQNVRLFARVALTGRKLTFDDLDSVVAGSRLRGHLALTLDEDRQIDGEVGLDSLDLGHAFALAIGAAGRDASEPLGVGLVKGWRGQIAFQALRGILPGGAELHPISGTLKGDGQSFTLDAVKGTIASGALTANIDARPSANGLAVNARAELAGADGAALAYRGLKMPPARTSLQMALSSQGRSASALASALSGNGTVTLESAAIAGLDPRAFDAAIRASDSGQPTDDARLKKIIEPILAAGTLQVPSAQIPFTIRDGRLRIGATTLDTVDGSRAIVSGGYDIPADQADIRANLSSSATGPANSRPEIQLFATGTPDAFNRTIDVTSLSSWLAVRTIDRETRRLDAIERGLPPPAPPAMPSPPTAALSPLAPPSLELAPTPSDQPQADVPLPGRDPRHFAPRPRAAVPHPPAPTPMVAPPVANRQVAPLPPTIEVKPPPGPAPAAIRPKPRPPLVLTPPSASP
jgi:uncharacterized protein involved in outer membrane biogenesis